MKNSLIILLASTALCSWSLAQNAPTAPATGATTAAATPAPAASAAPTPTPAGAPPAQGRGRRGGAGAPAQGRSSATSPAEPATRPANGPALISDDFESGAINKDLWDLRQNGAASVSVVQDKVAHGKYALKVHYPAGTRGAWAFLATKLPAALHDHLYGRVYVYASNLPVQNHSVFLSAGTPGWPISNFLEIGDDTGLFKPSYQLNGPTGTQRRGEITAKQGDIPQNRWFCLEWEFTDKPVERITIWVDGQQVADKNFVFNGENNGLVNGMAEFDLGFRSWAAANLVPNDVDVYYDDLAIGDKPIGQLTPVPAPAATTATEAKPAVTPAAATAP